MSKRGENIYKRKDGRWEGRYIKCRTLHGKIQYGYVYGKSYSEVKSKLKETTPMPIQTSNSQVPQPTSYNEILKMWLLSAKNHVKESTFSRYNHLVERHIQPFLGGYQIGEISNALLEKYIDYLLQCGRLDGSGGLSPKSVSDILVVIKRSMRYAQENNHLVICSTAGLSVKRSRKNMRVLSKIEQRQLEYVLMQDMDLTKFTVLLCLYTGIRIGEACALRWEHIRLDSGILEVRETMQRIQAPQNVASKTRIIITEPKSVSSNRDIPLPQFLMQYAVQFQADRNAFALQSVRMADARQHGSAHIAEQKDNIFLLGGERLCDLYRCHRFPTAGAAPDRQHTTAVILHFRFLRIALKDAGFSEIHSVTSLSGAAGSVGSPSSMGLSSGSVYNSSMSASCASMNCFAPSAVPR